MQNAIEMGLNYTGAQMSPLDSAEQLKAAKEVRPDVPGNEKKIALLRSSHAGEAEKIGSVPLPGSAKGMLKTALNKLVGVSPEVLIDKLGERLAFERTGTRLYEALMAKAQVIEPVDEEMLKTMKRFHDEEMQHFNLLVAALEKLGADPTAMTPCADVVGVSSMGIMQVISDPRTNLAQSLNALLSAELTDNAGWEMLIELAQISGQSSIAEGFEKALSQEQTHLATVKEWLNQEVTRQV
jgi:rubrerythrin